MSDTITLPSGVEVDQGRVLVIPGAGVVMPVGDLTPAEVQALRDDVQAVLNQTLGELSNVSEAGKAEGLVLAVQADGTWAPEIMAGAIDQVSTNWNGNQALDVTWLTLGPGLDVNGTLSPGRAHVTIAFGASGSQSVVARADHTHPPTRKGRFTFNQGGAVLSAGEIPLVSQSIPNLIPGVTYDVTVTGKVEVVNSNQSGRVLVSVEINGQTPQSLSRGASGGVWTPIVVTGTQMSVTGLSSLPVRFTVEYVSGDPTAIYSGDLVFDVAPRGGQS